MPIQMFDDEQDKFIKNIQNFGEQVGGILRDRLHKKQFEDFLAGPSKDFTDRMQEANDILIDETNPEAPAQGMQMLKGSLESYLDEGARYPDNPFIQQRVKMAFKSNMDFLNMNFKMKFEQAESDRATAKSNLEAEKWQVEKQDIQARTEKTLAEASKSRAEASNVPGLATNLFSGPPGSINPNQDESSRAHELWSRIENTINRPKKEAERKAVDLGKEDIRISMAQMKLAEMVGRGEKRSATVDSRGIPIPSVDWDIYNQEHLKSVADTIDPSEVQNRFVMKKAMDEANLQGISPEAIEKEFGVIVDPTKAGEFRPLTSTTSSENLGKILFGMGGWNKLQDNVTKARPKDLTDAASKLPDTIDDLSGPLATKFKQFMVGNLPENVDPKSIKNPDELQKLLKKSGYSLVTAIIGNNAPSNTLDEGMKRNRLEAAQLVNAMSEKYKDEIYEKVTGKKKEVKKEGLSDAKLVKEQPLLGYAARKYGAITGGLLKQWKAYSED